MSDDITTILVQKSNVAGDWQASTDGPVLMAWGHSLQDALHNLAYRIEQWEDQTAREECASYPENNRKWWPK